MFNIGFGEGLFIAALALILIGPKQLPEIARAVGKIVREIRAAMEDLAGSMNAVKDDIKEGTDPLLNEAREHIQPLMDVKNQINNLKNELTGQKKPENSGNDGSGKT